MSKVPHYRTDLVIARTEFGPLVKMLKAIAERNHFQYNRELNYITERGPKKRSRRSTTRSMRSTRRTMTSSSPSSSV